VQTDACCASTRFGAIHQEGSLFNTGDDRDINNFIRMACNNQRAMSTADPFRSMWIYPTDFSCLIIFPLLVKTNPKLMDSNNSHPDPFGRSLRIKKYSKD
jgi:hypothetical protein